MNQVNSMDSKLKNISEKSEVVNKDSLPPVRSSNKMTKPEADNVSYYTLKLHSCFLSVDIYQLILTVRKP